MNNGRITPALCCCVTGSLSLMFFQSMCRLFLLFSWFFCVCCSVENVPVRNSDVDYRLLEAAKAGDLDTVKVDDTLKMTIWHCCLWGVMLQSQENAGDCSMTKVIVTVCNRVWDDCFEDEDRDCDRLQSAAIFQTTSVHQNCEKMDVESVCHQSGIKWGQVGTL